MGHSRLLPQGHPLNKLNMSNINVFRTCVNIFLYAFCSIFLYNCTTGGNIRSKGLHLNKCDSLCPKHALAKYQFIQAYISGKTITFGIYIAM